jgi:DNA (cytosine-5)-methyltransferase 1
METKPSAVDLFCGAGGLSEGLRQAGYDVIGAVEIDVLACNAYRLNHASVKLWEMDITKLTGAAMMRSLGIRPGDLDLLAACPPCEGFSRMRTKNGALRNRDPRNDLIFDVLRMVRSMRPRSVMLENVPGLAKNKRYTNFCEGLESLGYRVKWDILNTADYAVPQRRWRLVLVASRVGEPEFAHKAVGCATVRRSIGNLTPPERSRDPLHNYTVRRSEKIESLVRKIPHNGGSRRALCPEDQLPCHKQFEGFWDVYGRMAWDKPSPTITGGCISPSKGRFLHPSEDRAITLREAALLQTFPRGYRFPLDQGRYSAAALIGNALPPEFIRRHAARLKAVTLSAAR